MNMQQEFLCCFKDGIADILSVIIATIAFIVSYAAYKKNKTISQRNASFQYILNLYVNKQIENTEVNRVLTEKGITNIRLLRNYFFRKYAGSSIGRWIYGITNDTTPTDCLLEDETKQWQNERKLMNQACFVLIDSLEILGEAYLSGLLQLGLGLHFVGNNFIEDWFCAYPWTYKLRQKENKISDEKKLLKRQYAELMAKLSFAMHLIEDELYNQKQNFFERYFSKYNLILTLEAFGHLHGACSILIDNIIRDSKSTSNNSFYNIHSVISPVQLEPYDAFENNIQKLRENVLPFILAYDLFEYFKKNMKNYKHNYLFMNIPDDLNKIVCTIMIKLREICYEKRNDKDVRAFLNKMKFSNSDDYDEMICKDVFLKNVRRMNNPFLYHIAQLKLDIRLKLLSIKEKFI